MPYSGPFNVYAAATSVPPFNGADQPIGNANPTAADFLGPCEFNGALYMLIQTVGSTVVPSLVYAVKSTDKGATWSILDSANSPVRGAALAEGATTAGVTKVGNKLWVCYAPTNGGAFTGAPMRLNSFDLSTETWGTVSATGPSAVVISTLYQRSDSTFIVVHNNGSISGTLMFSVYTPGSNTWSAATDLTTAWGTDTSNNAAACVLDSASTLHMICPAKVAGVVHHWVYQQVTLANAIQNFALIPTALYGDPQLANSFCGRPMLVGNSIIFGVTGPGSSYPALLIGAGINAAPSWSISNSMNPAGQGLRRLTPYALCFDPASNFVYGTATDANTPFTGGVVELVFCNINQLANGWNLLGSFDVTVDNSGFSYQFATPYPNADPTLPPYLLYQSNPPDTTGGFSNIQTLHILLPSQASTVVLNPLALQVIGLPNPAVSRNCN